MFHFLPSSVLHQVLAALHSARPAAFSPGRPHQFLANYGASMAFLSFLEGVTAQKVSLVISRGLIGAHCAPPPFCPITHCRATSITYCRATSPQQRAVLGAGLFL